MAKSKKVSTSSRRQDRDSKLVVFVLVAVVIGFIGGFFFARYRYLQRIDQISQMNMEKATQIDDLIEQMKVLGAQDSTRD